MADAEKVLLVWSFILIHKKVQAYYCDSDQCEFDEYCCGTNVCCTSYNVWQMWYFWCGLVLFLILLFACAGFWRYKYYKKTAKNPLSKNPYAKFDNTGSTATVTMHIRNDSDLSTLSDIGSDFRPHHLRTDSDLSVLSDDLTQYPQYNSHRTATPGYSYDYGTSGPPPYSQTLGGSGHYSKSKRDSHALLETEY